jgi:hypothetical protein
MLYAVLVQEVVLTKDVKATQTNHVYIYSQRQDGVELSGLLEQISSINLSQQPSDMACVNARTPVAAVNQHVCTIGVQAGTSEPASPQSQSRGRTRTPKRSKVEQRQVCARSRTTRLNDLQ